jgi:tungstate transport system substrate-binding protein
MPQTAALPDTGAPLLFCVSVPHLFQVRKHFTGGIIVLRSRIRPAVLLVATLLIVSTVLAGCGHKKSIVLATTTSTQDSGLLDVLLPAFTAKTGITVKPIAVGTGEAIAMGTRGDADVLLVHARSQEDKFVADGDGIDRRDVMYNDFVLVGPVGGKLAKGNDAIAAFKEIAAQQLPFVTRNDKSGTYTKEMSIWTKAAVQPAGDWYISTGQGMGDSLRIAYEKGAYILADRGTYLSLKDKYPLEVVIEKGNDLLNPYGVIAVNPGKHKGVNNWGAEQFINYITSPEGQKVIGDYGVEKFGQALFVPSATSK